MFWAAYKKCDKSSIHSIIYYDKGPFTDYVTHFSLFFDHPPTFSNALALTLLLTYHTIVFNCNAFANHPPIPIALRNL